MGNNNTGSLTELDLNYIQLRTVYSLKVTTRPVPDLPRILEYI